MSEKVLKVGDLFKNLSERNSGDYEYRPEQVDMSIMVEKALENSEILLIEAGTGVGKSLAYLLPASLYSLQTGKKVVISTETIALQNQLISKDIPLVREILNKDIKAEIALGSSNYICKRKMDHTISNGNFGIEMTEYLNDFYKWEKKTQTGIKSEFRGFYTQDFWSKVSRESENCLSRKCPNYDISYYFLEKEKWKNANLLIINHYLLASHIAGDLKILPEFQNLIIDEAHNFPEITGKSFRITITYEELLNIFTFIGGKDKKNTGLLGKIDNSLKNNKIIDLVSKKEDFLNLFFGKLFEEYPVLFQSLRVKKKINPDKGKLHDYLIEVSSILKSIKEKYNPETENILEKEIQMELDFAINKCITFSEALKMINKPDDTIVIWLEPPMDSSKFRFYGINAQPLHSGELLIEKLIPNMDSIVFTSATLSSNMNDFNYFKNQIGNPPSIEKSLPSPFPYSKNSLIYLPKNIRDPVVQSDDYLSDIIKLIPYLVNLSSGNCFVLFTSNKMMKDTYLELKDKLDFPIFSQHDLGAEKAKEEFLQTPDSVLFGVSTFWQGIDIKGDKLRSVIITKLPFQPPGEPVLEAKIEILKANKGNPFLEIQLPHAALTLKQGFGRLIRSKTDRGFVAILDPRIQTKNYGKGLVASLPPGRVVNSFKDLRVEYSNLFP